MTNATGAEDDRYNLTLFGLYEITNYEKVMHSNKIERVTGHNRFLFVSKLIEYNDNTKDSAIVYVIHL